MALHGGGGLFAPPPLEKSTLFSTREDRWGHPYEMSQNDSNDPFDAFKSLFRP